MRKSQQQKKQQKKKLKRLVKSDPNPKSQNTKISIANDNAAKDVQSWMFQSSLVASWIAL